ncbi:hypothetical protein B0H17DRAFT_1139241 [Mycena rosella]|uniref:Uncharacterized protein n=1 Tax=Mycena rosella TaxID=1033263 RepID=A0AAD7D611_MYCRO|nr:hypothetical protein B0H17DRAFT_1139241 [Mycena rosella]
MPAYSDVKLWMPRLHPYKEDVEIWAMDPIKTTFSLQLHGPTTTASGTRSRGKLAWDWTPLKILLTHEYWVEFASDWLSFCIGGEVTAKMPDEALSLSWDVILEVLYLRFSHVGRPDGDDLARALLLQTQMQNFRAYVNVPADFCWMDDLQQRDASDSDSDSDYMEGVKGCQSDSDSGDVYIPDFIQSQPIGLPTKDASLPLPVSINPVGLPEFWCQRMHVFFYPTVRPDQKYCRSKQDVVVDLRQMRKLPSKVWKTKELQIALEETGLLNLMHKISKPGNLLERTHPDIEQSFRFHNWKRSYSLLICRWTKATITKEERELRRPKPDPNYKFTAEDALELFVFISRNPLMHPWVFDPIFVYNSELWLAPALRTLDYPRISGWDPVKVYWTIMQLSLLADVRSPSSLSFLAALDTKLTLIISETSDHRAFWHEVCRQAWQPNFPGTAGSTQPPVEQRPSTKGQKRNASKRNKKENARKELKVEAQLLGLALEPEEQEYNCPNCRDLPADDQCLHRMEVFERTDAESLIGAALTCAPPDDRLSPCTPSTKRGDTESDTESDVPMKSTQYQVRQQRIAGTRQAQGGAKGDVYGPYACHSGDTADDIKALFRHATDADVMVEIRSTIMSGLRSDMIAVTNAAEYISTVHRDFDVGKHDLKLKEKGKQEDVSGCHPCVQLEQTGTDKTLHEWDFAMVRWGIVIETHSNTVWCFNGRHEHGSVIPSRSSHEANAVSSGFHPTKSKRDVDRAKVFWQIRLEMELRPRA